MVAANGTQTLDALRQEARTDTRERILEAVYACVARYGLAKTTVEDVARAAKLSRATLYRHFPGGRDQLLREVITWETGRFFGRLAEAVAGAADFPGLLEEALLFAHRAVEEHETLKGLKSKITKYLSTRSAPVVDRAADVVSSEIRSKAWVRADLLDEAVDALVRVILSHALSPSRRRIEDVAHDLAVMVTVALTGSETAGTKEVRR